MNKIKPRLRHRLLALAVILACAGCGTDQGMKVGAAPDTGGTGTPTPTSAAPPAAPRNTPGPASAVPRTGLVPQAGNANSNAAAAAMIKLAPNIRPDAQCQVPDETYDFTGVITARYGPEGALRLKKLLDTDFKESSISPKDKQLLNTLAREMLWIPASVEEQIGNLMFTFSSDLKTMPRDSNEEFWNGTAQLMSRLLSAAPKTPFDTRLVLVESGDPGSLAGGLVLLDADTVKSVFDDPRNAGRPKLNFILAHELAHIYKRHRAKRIQQLLVDSQSGLKLTRLIFKNVQQGKADLSATTVIQMATLFPEIIDLVRKNNAKYEQDQELEADGCATALMLRAAIDDPLAGFRAYRQDQRNQNKLGGEVGHWTPYVSHPPNDAREKNIQQRAAALTAQAVKDQAASRASAAPAALPTRQAQPARTPAAPANAASAPAARAR